MTGYDPRRATRVALASLLCAFFWGAPSAYAVSTIKLTSRIFERPGPGTDVVVAINVAPADGVAMMDFTFDYDPLMLSAVAVYRTGFTNAFALASDVAAPGVVEVHMTSASPLSGGGDVVWVLFRVVGPAGVTTDLTWFESLLNGGGIPGQAQSDTVSIVAAQSTVAASDTLKASPGTQVTVPITASTLNYCIGGTNHAGSCATGGDCPGGGSCGATGIDLSLRFNENVITVAGPASVQKTSITSSMSLTANTSVPGTVNITLFGTAPVRGSGALVNITCTVVGAIGTRTPLNVIRGGVNEGSISTNLDDGLFTVCDNVDGDGDGVTGCGGDCDNANPDVRPGATEVCNGIDDDCDGAIDEAVTCSDGDACTLNDACSAGICAGEPAPPPVEINDSVRVTPLGASATIAWSDPPGPFAVYRGLVPFGAAWSYDQTCLSGPTGSSSATDGSIPGTGGLFFYLVTRRTSCGESIRGRNSQGTPTPGASPCP